MPAGFFHTTFVGSFANDRLRPVAREALAREPVYARFGAVLPDLPYYHRLPTKAVQYSLGRKVEGSTWSELIHSHNPGLFFARFIEAARLYAGPAGEHERLALLLGLASHEAADSVIHPLVNWCADVDVAELGGAHGHHHVRIEKLQSAFFHQERLGHDLVGTGELRRQTVLTKRTSWVRLVADAPLVEIVEQAFRRAHGEAPARGDVARWIRAYGQFGLVMSSALARRNSARDQSDAFKRRYYRNEIFDFDAYVAAAQAYAIELCNLAVDYYQAADFSEAARAAFIAAVDFDPHIGAPTMRRCPPLPPLPLTTA